MRLAAIRRLCGLRIVGHRCARASRPIRAARARRAAALDAADGAKGGALERASCVAPRVPRGAASAGQPRRAGRQRRGSRGSIRLGEHYGVHARRRRGRAQRARARRRRRVSRRRAQHRQRVRRLGGAVERADAPPRASASHHGRRGPAADVSGTRARTVAARAAHGAAANTRRSGRCRNAGILARGVRRCPPLRHERDRHD